jgi:hypothetical protein
MLADLTDLLIGAGGTVLYLVVWHGSRSRFANASPGQRQRLRLVQILYFVLLTPYVLALFWLMERVRQWLGAAAPPSGGGGG